MDPRVGNLECFDKGNNMNQEEQLILIDADCEAALLLDSREREKRYTGAQAEKLNEKVEGILKLVGAGLPLEFVADVFKVSTRTIKTLASRHIEVLAQDAGKFGRYAWAKSGEFMYQASLKVQDAKFQELMVGHGIARDTAVALSLASSALPETTAIELAEEDPELIATREIAKQIMDKKP